MEDIKFLKTALIILSVLVLISIVAQWLTPAPDGTGAQIERIDRLRKNIEGLEAANKRIIDIISESEIRSDSLKQLIIENRQQYEKDKIRVRAELEDYRNSTPSRRDSIIRAYIRANQQPNFGG